jgi:hypothetical protein
MPKWVKQGNKYDNKEERTIKRFLLFPKTLPIDETENATCETRWLCIASFKRSYGYSWGCLEDGASRNYWDLYWVN